MAAQSCLVGLDGQDDPDELVTAALRADAWDCVIVRGGIRTAQAPTGLFERVINLVRVHAPHAAIAFNTTPSDTYQAAARWSGPSHSD